MPVANIAPAGTVRKATGAAGRGRPLGGGGRAIGTGAGIGTAAVARRRRRGSDQRHGGPRTTAAGAGVAAPGAGSSAAGATVTAAAAASAGTGATVGGLRLDDGRRLRPTAALAVAATRAAVISVTAVMRLGHRSPARDVIVSAPASVVFDLRRMRSRRDGQARHQAIRAHNR